MEDVQNIKGDFNFKIHKVGIQNFKFPISIKRKDGKIIHVIADFSAGVSLSQTLRGINMSRIPVFISNLSNDWIHKNLKIILEKLRTKLESDESFIKAEFDYFVNKIAPVSFTPSLINYRCAIDFSLCKTKINGKLKDNYDEIISVQVPITTLCPCSKAISNYSAHNQRSHVLVKFRKKNDALIHIEDIIDIVESSASCEIYSILKRPDEKYVTEKAYNNPKFVEDIVREVSTKFLKDDRIIWFKVKSVNMESIHNHDAIAIIEHQKQII